MTLLRAGLIGHHISRTRLPRALALLCAECGWRLEFSLIDTADDPGFDPAAQLDQAREAGWTGLTITHPWKPAARAWVGGAMRPDLAHLGAVNTVTFGADGTQGHNTDYTGFLGAMRHADIAPGRVVMVGAGGVAAALVPALLTLGATAIDLLDQDPTRARDLAMLDPRVQAHPLTALRGLAEQADGLINATPLGMAEHPGSAFAQVPLGPQSWAFDAVYTPTNTAFLSAARAAGLTCVSGFELFKHMAISSFAAYTGITVPATQALPLLAPLEPA